MGPNQKPKIPQTYETLGDKKFSWETIQIKLEAGDMIVLRDKEYGFVVDIRSGKMVIIGIDPKKDANLRPLNSNEIELFNMIINLPYVEGAKWIANLMIDHGIKDGLVKYFEEVFPTGEVNPDQNNISVIPYFLYLGIITPNGELSEWMQNEIKIIINDMNDCKKKYPEFVDYANSILADLHQRLPQFNKIIDECKTMALNLSYNSKVDIILRFMNIFTNKESTLLFGIKAGSILPYKTHKIKTKHASTKLSE